MKSAFWSFKVNELSANSAESFDVRVSSDTPFLAHFSPFRGEWCQALFVVGWGLCCRPSLRRDFHVGTHPRLPPPFSCCYWTVPQYTPSLCKQHPHWSTHWQDADLSGDMIGYTPVTEIEWATLLIDGVDVVTFSGRLSARRRAVIGRRARVVGVTDRWLRTVSLLRWLERQQHRPVWGCTA